MKNFNKRFFSFLMAMVMILSVGSFSLAEEKATVNFGVQYLNEDAIVADEEVELEEGDTVLTVFERVLDEKEVEYFVSESEYGPFLVSIKEYANGAPNLWSGWTFTVNGEMPEEGMDLVELEAGDDVHFSFSTNEEMFLEGQEAEIEKFPWAKEAIELAFENELVDRNFFMPQYNVTVDEMNEVAEKLGEHFEVEEVLLLEESEDMVNRQDVAKVLAQFVELDETNVEVLESYADYEDIEDLAKDSVAKLVQTKVLQGKSGNVLAVNDLTNKAEVAVLVYRILDK